MSFDQDFLNCDDFDLRFLIDEPCFPFENSPPDLDILNTNTVTSNENRNQIPITSNIFDDLSPPSHELNNLSLQNETHSQFHSSLPDNNSGFYSENGLTSELNDNSLSGMKLEDSFTTAGPHLDTSLINYDEKMMIQRSFSSHSLDQTPIAFFRPEFNPIIVPHFPTFYEPMIRKVSSTGDLQNFQRIDSGNGFSSSPLSATTENCSLVDDTNFKAKPYSAEEKKQRIHKYRNKRTQRNFTKTIKYACRKTLADSRPRVRGRFARHDGTSFEIPREAEDDFWGQMYEASVIQEGGGVCCNGYDHYKYLHHPQSFNEQQYQYFNGTPGTNYSTLPWNPTLSTSYSPQILRSYR